MHPVVHYHILDFFWTFEKVGQPRSYVLFHLYCGVVVVAIGIDTLYLMPRVQILLSPWCMNSKSWVPISPLKRMTDDRPESNLKNRQLLLWQLGPVFQSNRFESCSEWSVKNKISDPGTPYLKPSTSPGKQWHGDPWQRREKASSA